MDGFDEGNAENSKKGSQEKKVPIPEEVWRNSELIFKV